MPALSTAMAQAAQQIMAALGVAVTFRAVALGEYDVVDGGATDTPTDTPVKGVWQPYRAFEVAGGVQVGDRRLILAAADLPREPKASQDTILDGTLELAIVDTEVTRMQEQPVLYVLQLRGAQG